jgi:hypothetical protein
LQKSKQNWQAIHLAGKNNGRLPILRIKEQTMDTDYSRKSCHADISKQQKSYQTQFNGTDDPIQQIMKNDVAY